MCRTHWDCYAPPADVSPYDQIHAAASLPIRNQEECIIKYLRNLPCSQAMRSQLFLILLIK